MRWMFEARWGLFFWFVGMKNDFRRILEESGVFGSED